MRAHMSSIVEGLQPAPNPRPFILHESGVVLAIASLKVHIRCFGIDPLLDFDGAGAVVKFVCDVGGLGGDVADLADEG